MAFLNKYLARICVSGLIITVTGLGGCTETVRTIENDAYKVTVSRLNPSAFDAYILSVYLEPKNDKRFQKAKLLEIEGPDDFEGEFINRDLLVLKAPPGSDIPVSRLHFLLQVPVECVSTIEMSSDEFLYPFASNDSIPYAIDYSGNRQVSLERTWHDKVFIVKTDDTTKVRHFGVIRIAPVEKLAGELIHEDTLRLSVTWCGEDKAQDILVKLPTSKAEDLEYIVRE